MNFKTLRYLNHIIEHHNIEFACTMLENYSIKYVEDFLKGKNNGENIPEFFGELAFLYSKSEIDDLNIKRFIDKMLDSTLSINTYIAVHISNFLEIVLFYKSELINFYIEKVQKYRSCSDEDNISLLSSAVILPVIKNGGSVEDILPHIVFPWRSYFILANYYIYYNQNTAALNYAIKALKTCPDKLKNEYCERKKLILKRIME